MAAAFQAWGFREPHSTTAESLGMFYLDNAGLNRWTLRVSDPEVLSRIDTLFVTVEPPGGSRFPKGGVCLWPLSPGRPTTPEFRSSPSQSFYFFLRTEQRNSLRRCQSEAAYTGILQVAGRKMRTCCGPRPNLLTEGHGGEDEQKRSSAGILCRDGRNPGHNDGRWSNHLRNGHGSSFGSHWRCDY